MLSKPSSYVWRPVSVLSSLLSSMVLPAAPMQLICCVCCKTVISVCKGRGCDLCLLRHQAQYAGCGNPGGS